MGKDINAIVQRREGKKWHNYRQWDTKLPGQNGGLYRNHLLWEVLTFGAGYGEAPLEVIGHSFTWWGFFFEVSSLSVTALSLGLEGSGVDHQRECWIMEDGERGGFIGDHGWSWATLKELVEHNYSAMRQVEEEHHDPEDQVLLAKPPSLLRRLGRAARLLLGDLEYPPPPVYPRILRTVSMKSEADIIGIRWFAFLSELMADAREFGVEFDDIRLVWGFNG